ncbi:MAG TPA: ComF family protein [Chthonomonadaceae bacterium]|nr:ComF family protein [Chthonomonadaceae bacterium]
MAAARQGWDLIRDTACLAWDGLLDLLYPPCCLVCGRDDAEPFCAVCRAAISPLSPPFCDRCGIQVGAGRLVCDHCEEGPQPDFAWSQAVGLYAGVLLTAIQRLKYDGKLALAAPLGALLAESLRTPSPLLPAGQRFDLIVPVPLHRSKFRARGFNQAERLARTLVAPLGCPLSTDALVRARRTPTQTALGRAERRRNVQGVFEVLKPEAVEGRSVLLIDDVLTTMSTVNECARVLRNAGARRVAVLALARGM